jgi:hypothetical protein
MKKLSANNYIKDIGSHSCPNFRWEQKNQIIN